MARKRKARDKPRDAETESGLMSPDRLLGAIESIPVIRRLSQHPPQVGGRFAREMPGLLLLVAALAFNANTCWRRRPPSSRFR